MKLVGLTGGIGSGKSTVSRLLSERGAVIVDADQVARELQQAGSALVEAMAEAFGDHVVDDAGNLDRAAVAELVFGDSEAARANLQRLNAITHPAIHDEIEQRIAGHIGSDALVVLDHPLLVERPREGIDTVIVVDIPVELQVERLVEFRGMDETDARKRIASQASRDERLAVATHVIDNSGGLDTLEQQVDELYLSLSSPSTSPSRATPSVTKPNRS